MKFEHMSDVNYNNSMSKSHFPRKRPAFIDNALHPDRLHSHINNHKAKRLETMAQPINRPKIATRIAEIIGESKVEKSQLFL